MTNATSPRIGVLSPQMKKAEAEIISQPLAVNGRGGRRARCDAPYPVAKVFVTVLVFQTDSIEEWSRTRRIRVRGHVDAGCGFNIILHYFRESIRQIGSSFQDIN